MSMTCKELGEKLKDFSNNLLFLQQTIAEYTAIGVSVKKDELLRNLKILSDNIEVFMQEYEQAVIELLKDWSAELLNRHFLLSRDRIKITPEGRVEITADLHMQQLSVNYFPKIIRKVAGTVLLPQTIDNIEGVEEINSLRISAPTFKSTTLRKARFINAGESHILELPNLEGQVYIKGERLTELKIPRIKILNRFSFSALIKGDFSSLNYTLGDFVLNMIKSIDGITFPELISTTGGIVCRFEEGVKFRDVFPKLAKVGVLNPANEVSFFISSPSPSVKEEILQAQKEGSLHFNGKVL